MTNQNLIADDFEIVETPTINNDINIETVMDSLQPSEETIVNTSTDNNSNREEILNDLNEANEPITNEPINVKPNPNKKTGHHKASQTSKLGKFITTHHCITNPPYTNK